MFKDKYPSFSEHRRCFVSILSCPTLFRLLICQDDVGQFGQTLKGVWRVSEDEVKLLAACLQESEDISSDEGAVVSPEFLQTLSYESGMFSVCLHADNMAALS